MEASEGFTLENIGAAVNDSGRGDIRSFMRVQLRTYGSCFPFVMAGLLILLGFLGWETWQWKKDADALKMAGADLKSLGASLNDYASDNEGFPTTAQGLDALIRPPTTEPLPKKWRGPYRVGLIPRDPWGNPYEYRSPGFPARYYLGSRGPDGKPGTEDDIAP